jgi:cytochrome c
MNNLNEQNRLTSNIRTARRIPFRSGFGKGVWRRAKPGMQSADRIANIFLQLRIPEPILKALIPIGLLACIACSTPVHAMDEVAAEALARKSRCFKCHTIDKKKDGPAYKDIAAKYKGKADAEQKITTHITTSPKVKIDGEEEDHEQIKTKDAGEIKNVVQWILSR